MKGAILANGTSSSSSVEESSKEVLQQVTEIDLFLSVLNYMKDFVSADATYSLNKER